MTRNILILFLLFLSVGKLYSQQDTTLTTDIIENYFDEEQAEDEDSQLYDLFEYIIQNPIDINTSDKNDLLTIPTIDIRIASAVIAYRNEHGSFSSIYDLQKIPQLSQDDVNKLMPFITVTKTYSTQTQNFLNDIITNTAINFRSRTLTDLQNKNGFTTGKYIGTKPKTYSRLQARYGNRVYTGVLVEKDAGENSINDFSSFFVEVKEIGIIKNVIAGDFLVEFGQGLAMWSPYAFSKGADAVASSIKRARDVTPYTSADENQFFRGVASSINIGGLKATAFYSKNNLDANIDTLTNLITSTPLDGYHRTDSEINKKNRTVETIFGTAINYNINDNFSIGGLFYKSKFDNGFEYTTPLALTGDAFDFYSVSYNTYYQNLAMSGEFAYNGISVASLNKLQISFSKNLSLVTLIRSYPRNFSNLHSRGFGESGGTQNEFGIYTGLRWRTPIGLFNIYYDQFKFPFATYYNPVPSTGHEYMINYEVKPFNKTSLLLRYKRENKETSTAINDETKLVDQIKQNLRFEIKYRVSKLIQLRTRVELMFYDLASMQNEKGFLAFQDAKYQPNDALRFYGRIIFFQTDSYDSRIYEFENDLIGVMTNSALYGKGIKWYMLINYKPLNWISISAKYSEMYKPDERTLGSGLSEINTNIDNKFSFQIDIFL